MEYGLKLFLPFLLLLLASGVEAEDWNLKGIEVGKPIGREEFEARVKGSFGFLSEREPKLNMAEYAILEKFVPFLEDDPDFALEMIEGLTENNKDLSASFDYMLGNMYAQHGRIEKAETAFKNAIGKYPDYLRAWRAIGMLYLHGDSLDNALDALTRSIQLGDTDPYTFGQIGYCFYQKKEYLSSLSAYTQAILYEPGNIRWMRGKIASLRALQDFRQASVLLQELVRKRPDEAAYWMELANCWIRLKEPRNAIACLEFLRGARLGSEASLAMLGTLYVNESLPSLARGVYEEMIAQGYGVSGASLLRCARLLHGNGRMAEADELVSAFLEQESEPSVEERNAVLLYRAGVAEAAGELHDATLLVKEVLNVSPNDGEATILLGRLQYRNGDAVGALLSLERAGRSPEFAAESLVLQAQIRVDQKNFSAALEALESALALGENDWVRDYYSRIAQLAKRSELERIVYSSLLED